MKLQFLTNTHKLNRRVFETGGRRLGFPLVIKNKAKGAWRRHVPNYIGVFSAKRLSAEQVMRLFAYTNNHRRVN